MEHSGRAQTADWALVVDIIILTHEIIVRDHEGSMGYSARVF